jgi:hypothetical protein
MLLNTRWSTPTEVGLDDQGYRVATGPFDAPAYMIDSSFWPVRTGPLFLKAKIACKAAVEGRISPERARNAFVAAAEEAKLITY